MIDLISETENQAIDFVACQNIYEPRFFCGRWTIYKGVKGGSYMRSLLVNNEEFFFTSQEKCLNYIKNSLSGAKK